MLSGIIGIAGAIFGVIWTIFAFSAGAGPFALFGIVFIIIAVIQAVYNFKNATGKNRYSSFDITDENEEPDPFNQRFGNNSSENDLYDSKKNLNSEGRKFCPYCGERVNSDHQFCQSCGKKLQ